VRIIRIASAGGKCLGGGTPNARLRVS
jgi:hypothetical protein